MDVDLEGDAKYPDGTKSARPVSSRPPFGWVLPLRLPLPSTLP